MRGALITVFGLLEAGRIIPAYAGSTIQANANRVRLGDHPRVCGEHMSMDANWPEYIGSSPRMRGAQMQAPAA